TRVPWAAHSYNIAFSDEIGHFDYCTATPGHGKKCTGFEGVAGDQERADSEDLFCFRASESSLVPITGCQGTNGGFDGVPYKPLWADGNPDHAGAFFFTGFRTGQQLNVPYSRLAFEADLPRIEIAPAFQNCNRTTGANCTLIPVTDDGTPADFYPFYSNGAANGACSF